MKKVKIPIEVFVELPNDGDSEDDEELAKSFAYDIAEEVSNMGFPYVDEDDKKCAATIIIEVDKEKFS